MVCRCDVGVQPLKTMQDAPLRSANSADWPTIEILLVQAGLPTEDLHADKLANFLVMENASGIVGLVGVEDFGDAGLLRSLVVAQTVRGQGLGKTLLGAAELAAQNNTIRDLWLLTIDAQDFFGNCGYRIAERSSAPARIRTTDEFSTLCPQNAFLMVKRLPPA